MVWAAIYLTGRSALVVMTPEETDKKSVNSKIYTKTLQEGLLPIYKDSKLFQQDNARIHTSRESIRWLRSKAIDVITWPAKSPDLSPIEHIWPVLKRKLFKAHPDLYEFTNNLENIRKFKVCLQEAWAAIDDSHITKILESSPRRLEAVKAAGGYHTRY